MENLPLVLPEMPREPPEGSVTPLVPAEIIKPAERTVVTETDTVERGPPIKRGRGRPQGSKDQKARKPRKRKREEMEQDTLNPVIAFQVESDLPELSDSFDVDEEIEEIQVYLSTREALSSKDAPSWVAAMTKEKTKLHAFETWREMTDEEKKLDKKPIPVAVILTKKRCGTFKARAVVLGNQYLRDPDLCVYAPVVSQVANRYLLIDSASKKDYIIAFDQDNAFLNAFMDDFVKIRIPDELKQTGNEPNVKVLVRALYGLPQSPRLWAKHYNKTLTGLGWEENPFEPGLYRRRSKIFSDRWLRLSVYVDDNLASGPCKRELEEAVKEIFKIHPGKIIHPDKIGKYLRWDILGADVLYCQEEGFLKIVMTRYVEKKIEKFNLKGHKNVFTPNFDPAQALPTDKDVESVKFPYRELIGVLSWVANICRPDIAYPVNVLSRYSCGPVTDGLVSAAKKILKYLGTTKEIGLVYSTESNQEFNNVYRGLLKESQEMGSYAVFSDASFANCSVTLKSTSGSIVYFKGTPIWWRTQRQTIRTYSTTEAEWVAASDTIVATEQLGFQGFFQTGAEMSLTDSPVFVDNSSAIMLAKKSKEESKLQKKSKHFLLRYHRVADENRRLAFCPTGLQKADSLTKLVSSNVNMGLFCREGKRVLEVEKEEALSCFIVCFN